MKAQTHNPWEAPLEYNQDQTPLMNQGSLWPSWRSEFLEKFLANNFTVLFIVIHSDDIQTF